MEFHHICEALEYASRTGDQKPLIAYHNERIIEAAKQIEPFVNLPAKGDDVYFRLAYAEAFLDVAKASLSPDEQKLVGMIKENTKIMVVRMPIVMPPQAEE